LEHAPVRLDRPWIPVAVAVGIAAVMLLLASGPFEERSGRYAMELPPIALVAPRDTLAAFPARFEWAPVDDAAYYLVGVARVDSGRVERLFRQQGRTNVLELQVEPGAGPPGGDYAWEVLAFGTNGLPSAKGTGSFTVR